MGRGGNGALERGPGVGGGNRTLNGTGVGEAPSRQEKIGERAQEW